MPGSVSRPQTAFTFDALESFHLLTLQGKTSSYDYYATLECKTDNVGGKIKVRNNHILILICHKSFLRADMNSFYMQYAFGDILKCVNAQEEVTIL